MLAVGAIASGAAALLHGVAAGTHADHGGLSRIFIALALAQGVVAMLALMRPSRLAAWALGGVSAAAVAGWAVTRTVGIDAIGGLEVAEAPRLADTSAAALAAIACVAALTRLRTAERSVPARIVAASALVAGALLVPGLADAIGHDQNDHDDETAHAAGDGHGDDVAGDAAAEAGAGPGDDHDDDRDDGHGADHDAAESASAEGAAIAADGHDHAAEPVDADTTTWPRPWDPTGPIDFSGVDGVSPEQQVRAERLVVDTLRELPAFADVDALGALGYRSIGDANTGHEHYINVGLIGDDKFLDPTAPESLVFEVNGDERTLVSAMFIADQRPIDDPSLTDFAGQLMQWHVHDNLCWGLNDAGEPVVKGVLENFGGTCPAGTINAGGENPMVHVWIAPHECGPFAALEGHGAGQAAVSEGTRMDQCAHDGHGGNGDDHGGDEAAMQPYDPELPIDLGGMPGVTPQQQAFAENLVAATVRDLPQWADLDAVEAAGFHSIGDGATGHEHYIQWDWIDDDVWLDPDYPESLVFEPQPDGSKRLVSAMYMMPSGTPLDEVPDWGGDLMQWHVHGDLCFTDDPVAPRVAGIKPIGSTCAAPLVDGTMAPMIHVWIRPHECGPFAALDGIGGGQVPDGEVVSCLGHADH